MREVPSIPAGLDPKLRNVLSAVRESLNAAITNINANADNLNGLRQWVMPALEANNDLAVFNQGQINAALESAAGADGAAGIAARAVSLTTPSQSFTYDTNGANPSPATSVITATVFNTVGVVYYEFFLNDVSTGTATTSNTYTYTPRSAFTGMPDKLEVQIREDGLDGAIEARDQMTMIGLKAGSHGITVMLSNEAHTLPRSTAGVVTYTGSGTKINVWEGTTALTEDSSSPYANSTFRVTTAATGITPGSITGTGTTTLTYGDANSMTTSPAKIDFTIIAKRQDGTEITISKQQSLSYSQAGATGAGGDAVDLVFVRAASQPATPTASSGTPTAPITWYTDVASVPASANPLWSSAGFKASASANYTWDTPVRVEGASVAEVTVFTRGVPTSTPTGGTYTFSTPPVLAVPTSTGATWYTSIPSGTTAVYTSRAVVSTAAGNTSAVAITGWTIPVISFQNGADAVLSDLSNDNHTFPTDSSGSNGNFTGCATTMSVFLGSSDDSANWTYAVTKSTGVTCTEAITSRTQTVTAMTTDTGTVTIVASKSGFANQTQVFSISKAKSGVAYSINLSNNSVRKSSAGVLSPTSLTLTASKIDVSGVTAYTGRFKIYLNGSATATYTSAADEASKAYTVTATDTTIKCELYLAGGTTTLVDTETVLVVVDGGNGVSINVVELYQQAASPPALPTGTSYDFSTDTLSGTLGSWIRTMPASSTVPTYMTVCTFTVTAPTTSQTRTSWSTAVIAAQNGTVLNIDPSVTYSFAGSVPTGAGFTFTLFNCTAASSNGGTSVALTSTADPYVVLSGLSLNPVDNYIIALRVKIPIGTGIDGNLFYANSSHSYIEGVNKLSMAGLIGTGDWQTIVVDASNTTSDWLTGGTVTGLRFDFVHAIATINLAYISIGKYGISKGARATFTTYAAVASAAWNDATAYAAITGMTGSGGSLLIGDEVTLCYPSVAAATYVITRYVTAVGNPGTWTVRGQVIDGNLMVTGTLSAASLKTSNLSAATAITVGTATNGLILSSVDNTLKVIQNSATRVTFGNLVGTYGIEGSNSAGASVFKLNENGLDAKITQSALKLIGCSYHSQIVLEGDYTFTIYGSAVQTVVIPIPISTVGMYQIFARVTAYWENDLSGSSSYASHALWREMSMGVYYKNAYTTSGGGNDISKVISMGEVRQGDDTTDTTYFPYTKIKLQVNSVTAANLVVGTDYTITTVGTTNWNTVSGGDLITPYLINSSFRAAVAGTGTGVATTGNPEISLENRVGNSTATNTTTFSYTILAVDNKMYPFEVF